MKLSKKTLIASILCWQAGTVFATPISDLVDQYCEGNRCAQPDMIADFVSSAEPGVCLVVTEGLQGNEFSRFYGTKSSWWLMPSYSITQKQKMLARDVAKQFYSSTVLMGGYTVYWAEPFKYSVNKAIDNYCLRAFYISGKQSSTAFALLIPKSK